MIPVQRTASPPAAPIPDPVAELAAALRRANALGLNAPIKGAQDPRDPAYQTRTQP